MHPIERYRKAKGWTQAALAKEVGVSTNTVQAWEKGSEPRPSKLPRLSEVLGVETLRLLGEIEAWQQMQARKTTEA